MDLNFTADEERFREEVRAFLDEKLPSHISQKVRSCQPLTKQEQQEWHAVLNERGWYASQWPVEYGGAGWTITQSYIFDVERARAHAPGVLPFGVRMLGPVLLKYGTAEQKAYWLPRMLDGTDWWCQGYSEPGAGSDLASLKTSAVRDGEHYIVNGQKTWTTLAQHANMIFCLVRTSKEGKKQQGISFLLIDLDTPGVEVRPIRLLSGEHEVNEVFFTDVRVPVANRVGEENMGWTYAKYLLTHERTEIAGIGWANIAFAQLKEVARNQTKNGRPLAEDPLFAARVARAEIDLENMRITNLRAMTAAGQGVAPGAESSMLKIRGTEIRQEISSLIRRAMGPYAQPFIAEALFEGMGSDPIGPEHANAAAAEYFNNRKLSIYGGSNEVQREIIAKSILEL